MGILDRIRSWLGRDGTDRGDGRDGSRATDVRVERDPDQGRDGGAADSEPNTTTEAAVKGADEGTEPAAEETDAAASTGTMTEEPPGEDERAEPAEAAGPASDAEPDLEPEPEDDAGAELDQAEEEESAASGTDASASTGAMTEEPPGDDERAEPAEAAGPASDAETEMETEAKSETDRESDEGGAARSESVETVNGVGSAYGKRLADAGVETVGDLLDADAADLADESGISEKRIRRWQDAAAKRFD